MTSIEKFRKELENYGLIVNGEFFLNVSLNILEEIFQEYQKLHKQEIRDAFDEGQEYEYQYHINNAPKFDSETYYQETFVSKGSDDHISDISKMVEVHPLEVLRNKIKNEISDTMFSQSKYSSGYRQAMIVVEDFIMDILAQLPQQETITAVNFLLKYIEPSLTDEQKHFFSIVIQQSKEMEKQQIINAFDEGQECEYQYHINNAPKFDSETYYQETFKK